MDIEAFRLNTPHPTIALPAIVGFVTGRRKKGPTTDPFLAGPVPMWWLERAYRLGAAALAVGLALWHARGLRRGQPGGIRSTRQPGVGWAYLRIRPGEASTHSTAIVW